MLKYSCRSVQMSIESQPSFRAAANGPSFSSAEDMLRFRDRCAPRPFQVNQVPVDSSMKSGLASSSQEGSGNQSNTRHCSEQKYESATVYNLPDVCATVSGTSGLISSTSGSGSTTGYPMPLYQTSVGHFPILAAGGPGQFRGSQSYPPCTVSIPGVQYGQTDQPVCLHYKVGYDYSSGFPAHPLMYYSTPVLPKTSVPMYPPSMIQHPGCHPSVVQPRTQPRDPVGAYPIHNQRNCNGSGKMQEKQVKTVRSVNNGGRLQTCEEANHSMSGKSVSSDHEEEEIVSSDEEERVLDHLPLSKTSSGNIDSGWMSDASEKEKTGGSTDLDEDAQEESNEEPSSPIEDEKTVTRVSSGENSSGSSKEVKVVSPSNKHTKVIYRVDDVILNNPRQLNDDVTNTCLSSHIQEKLTVHDDINNNNTSYDDDDSELNSTVAHGRVNNASSSHVQSFTHTKKAQPLPIMKDIPIRFKKLLQVAADRAALQRQRLEGVPLFKMPQQQQQPSFPCFQQDNLKIYPAQSPYRNDEVPYSPIWFVQSPQCGDTSQFQQYSTQYSPTTFYTQPSCVSQFPNVFAIRTGPSVDASNQYGRPYEGYSVACGGDMSVNSSCVDRPSNSYSISYSLVENQSYA